MLFYLSRNGSKSWIWKYLSHFHISLVLQHPPLQVFLHFCQPPESLLDSFFFEFLFQKKRYSLFHTTSLIMPMQLFIVNQNLQIICRGNRSFSILFPTTFFRVSHTKTIGTFKFIFFYYMPPFASAAFWYVRQFEHANAPWPTILHN